jgi:hypothetical protein
VTQFNVLRARTRRVRARSARTLTVILAGTLPSVALGAGLIGAPGAAAATVGVRPAATARPVAAKITKGPVVSTGTLVQAYVSARHLPVSSVAGIRADSLHTASVAGVSWAIADFTPSASAGSGVQAEFQDGASTGIFSQRAAGSWQLVQTGPYGCGRGLPSGLSQAWGLPAPVICQAAVTTQRSAASAALSQAGNASTIGQSIAKSALGQVGVGDSPAATSFSDVDCDPYSSLVGALSPNADGCGYNTTLNVADENEAWCSDFAKWAWQQAGVTTDMSAITANSGSFYEWGQAQDEKLKADSGKPAAGDAVVFFPPGHISSPAYGDHVGIVSSVNSDGTVGLVNGDFLGSSNISVQYATKVSLTKWAAQIWGPGEQWVLVAPPAGPQKAAATVTISGSHIGVAGSTASFSAKGSVAGGSVTGYQWTFGDGRTANQAGESVSTVFPGPGIYPVTVTATSSLHTVVTQAWNIDVIGGSATTASTPSDAVWYSTTPVSQDLFLPSAGGLAAETSDGAGWLQQSVPGQLAAGGGLTALAYPDPNVSDAMTPHAYFRASGGTLAQTYLGSSGWTTQSLAGQPVAGSALVATTAGNLNPAKGIGAAPTVFYFNASGQLSQTAQQGASWVTSTFSAGPKTTQPASLALANTDSGGVSGVQVFYLGTSGALTVASHGANGWGVSTISGAEVAATDTPLAASSTASGQASVFFVDTKGAIAVASGSGQKWTASELPGTSAATALAATADLLSSGSPGQELFWISKAGQAAVTAWNGSKWQTSTLPGAATSISGVSAYPAAGQPQEAFLADGPTLRLESSPAPGSAWTATAVPDTSASLADRVLLYAATSADDTSALSAASTAGLPATQVTTSFSTAWAATLSGNYLVIAVGSAAVDALDFNTCGWANPSGDGAGGSPFSPAAGPLDKLPGARMYENAAAATGSQTPKLASGLAYYATHGALPAGTKSLPSRAGAQRTCAGKA